MPSMQGWCASGVFYVGGTLPKGFLVAKRLRAAAFAAACLFAAVLLAPGSASAKTSFSTPLQLPGSFGFGEPSIAIGSGRIVVTAPNGLLTTTIADQPSAG